MISQASDQTVDDQLDPLLVAERWMLDGRGVAVATVIETWGSAPTAGRQPSGDRWDGQFQRLGFGWAASRAR